MESILTMNDEVYAFRSHRAKSSQHILTNSDMNNGASIDRKSNPERLATIFQQMKSTFVERSLYILGILNLILAGVAILCVTQAEDHPEYFSLVYVAVSIFIFYMATILLIIIVQIIETCREQKESSSIPLSQAPSPPTQVPVESMQTIITTAKSKVSRSQTMPLTSNSSKIFINSAFNQHMHGLSTATSSSTLRDFDPMNASTRLFLLPKYQQTFIALPKNYQSFGSPTLVRCCPSCTNVTSLDDNPQLATLIKPIPMTYSRENHTNKPKTRFADVNQ